MSSADEAAAPEGLEHEHFASAPRDSIAAAREALGHVYDPELYLDIVSLGLVYDIRHEGETIVVEMTLTTPGCPASESIPTMAQAAVAASQDDPLDVDVRIVWDPPWNPSMIDVEAAAKLGFRVR